MSDFLQTMAMLSTERAAAVNTAGLAEYALRFRQGLLTPMSDR